MQALELKVPPLLQVALFGLAMAGIARWLPALRFAIPGSTGVALLLAAGGMAIAVAGIVAFRRQRTTVDPRAPDATSSLVTRGIYRLSRNPMYLGFALALCGWAVYLSNWGAALLVPAFIGYMTRFQIEPEERALLAKFGIVYAEYMDSVRRWA